MALWTRLAGWLLGLDLNKIVAAVTATLNARIKAQADTSNIATQAELQMQLKTWDAQVENWRLQQQLLIVEHGWWISRWQRPVLFYCFALHVLCVVLASAFPRLGWTVAALPAPLDWLETGVLGSYFLLRSVEKRHRSAMAEKVKARPTS